MDQSNVPPQVIRGKQGGMQLVYDGHCYTKSKNTDGQTVWECSLRSCRAKIRTTNADNLPISEANHNHPADPTKCLAKVKKSQMIESILREPNQSTGQLCQKHLTVESPVVSTKLPSRESICRSLRYHRSKTRPPLPATAEALVVPANYQTVNNERFLQRDMIVDGARMLIFISDFLLYFLCAATLITCDGTFDCVPTIFTQLFTVHFFYMDKLLPAAYVLMKGKSQILYSTIFSELKSLALQKGLKFSPKSVLCDFERAILNSISLEFPETVRKGCFFHFCQAVYRKVQELGLAGLYLRNDNFRLLVRILMSLAFLPNEEVGPTFLSIEAKYGKFSEPVTNFFNYFHNQWVKDIDIWNVNGQQIRTNNDLEGWHSKMSKFL